MFRPTCICWNRLVLPITLAASCDRQPRSLHLELVSGCKHASPCNARVRLISIQRDMWLSHSPRKLAARLTQSHPHCPHPFTLSLLRFSPATCTNVHAMLTMWLHLTQQAGIWPSLSASTLGIRACPTLSSPSSPHTLPFPSGRPLCHLGKPTETP